MSSYTFPRPNQTDQLPMGTTMAADTFEESSADPMNDPLSRSRSFDRHILYAQNHGLGFAGAQSPPMPSPPRFPTTAGVPTMSSSYPAEKLGHHPSISFQQSYVPGGLKEQMSMFSLQGAAAAAGAGAGSVVGGQAPSISGNTIVVGASQAKEDVDKTTEVLQSKLPNFMRSVPENVRDKLPPNYRDYREFDVEDGGKGGNGGGRWTAKDYYDYYTRKTLERRLTIKNLIIATLAEFVGTFMFLFFALAINSTAATVEDYEKSAGYTQTDLTGLLVSSVGFAFSLAISAWVFFRVSGGVQNPAITLALMLTGALTWTRAICLTVAQYLGAIAASGLIVGLYPHHTLNSRTTLGPNTTINQGFWLELLMSAQLIFTVLMLAAEKHRGTFLAPVGIGLCLFITQLLGQPYTGASVNPARTLGPDVAQKMFSGYCWIYYAAPYLAAIITSGFYLMLKWLRYETATPDQDADEARAGQTCQVLVDSHGNHVGRLDTFNVEQYQAIIDANEKAEQEEIIAKHKEMQAQIQLQQQQAQLQAAAAAAAAQQQAQQGGQQSAEDGEKEYLQQAAATAAGTTGSAYGGTVSMDMSNAAASSDPGRRPSVSSQHQGGPAAFNRSYSVSSPKRAAFLS